jgi:hypothetical protein
LLRWSSNGVLGGKVKKGMKLWIFLRKVYPK